MNGEKNNINVLVSVTTTYGSDWRNKFAEASTLGITECALFPTTLSKKEREEYFSLLKNSNIKSCPFVHLRSDMTQDEIEYLAKNFGTKVFNTHCQAEYPHVNDWSKYADRIYIENLYHDFDCDEMKNWAGICLDVSHLENDRRQNKARFKSVTESLKIYPIGCNHISGVADNIRTNSEGEQRFDTHHFENLSDFDYLRNYPKKYFSRFCAIEVENTLQEQLAAKKYIETILAGI
ncbi:MAG TPA: hypothetical protein P5080_05410 [Candidatus Paceibacterota bacterium]|nr:hypothetical protein [Candidatus Pacearchaeota archaeon]HRZ51385.1 hypothetical protein [Candidatus Paceibacterota bacterium]HSA37107.1 hypothetical protein [Candidatus Paceibacterota bacterium]